MSDNATSEAPTVAGYFGDGPVHTEAEDEFGRYPFARTLAASIVNHPGDDCLVLGLYAPWGAGKTTVLNFLARELLASEKAILVSFNPWRYSGEEELLDAFYTSIGEALDVKLRRWYEGSIAKQTVGGLEHASAIGAAALGPGGAAIEPIGKALSGLAKKLTDIALQKVKERVLVALADQKLRVVVLMDDLDRLEASEVHALLRLVRLSADFPRTTYVLAADEDMVAATLSQRFQGEKSETAGRSFLEKIVQVPLHLPPCDPNVIRRMAAAGFGEALAAAGLKLAPESERRLSTGFDRVLWPELTTPRMVKRLVNAVRFRLALAGIEVNPADFILLEGLRLICPEIYALLATSRVLLLGAEEGALFPERGDSREAHKGQLDTLLRGLDGDRRVRVQEMLALLFPHVRFVLTNHDAPDQPPEQWSRAKRVCTHEYFARHFAAGVLSNDIADSSVSLFASLLSSGDAEGARKWLDDVGGRADAPYLLEKLRRFLADSTGDAALQAAMGLARLGHRFSADEIGILFPPRAVAVGMVGGLLRRIDDRQMRADAGLATVSEPVNLDVAVRVFDTVAVYEDKNRPRATFTKEEQDWLLSRVVQRLEGAASKLASIGGQHLARVLWAWGRIGALQGATGWFERSYEKDATILDRVLLGFAGESWEVETGHTRPTLSRGAFEQLTSSIDASVLERCIGERFGAELRDRPGGSSTQANLNLAAAVALQFLEIRQQTRVGSGATAGDEGGEAPVDSEGPASI